MLHMNCDDRQTGQFFESSPCLIEHLRTQGKSGPIYLEERAEEMNR